MIIFHHDSRYRSFFFSKGLSTFFLFLYIFKSKCIHIFSYFSMKTCCWYKLEVTHWGTSNYKLLFNDMSTLVGYFVSSPREREKRDRRTSRGEEKEKLRRMRKTANDSAESEEKITYPLPHLLQVQQALTTTWPPTLIISTHNICFSWKNKKNIDL